MLPYMERSPYFSWYTAAGFAVENFDHKQATFMGQRKISLFLKSGTHKEIIMFIFGHFAYLINLSCIHLEAACQNG